MDKKDYFLGEYQKIRREEIGNLKSIANQVCYFDFNQANLLDSLPESDQYLLVKIISEILQTAAAIDLIMLKPADPSRLNSDYDLIKFSKEWYPIKSFESIYQDFDEL